MKKLATVQDVLRHSADSLVKTAKERDWYKEKYEKLAQEHAVSEVLSLMDERGINPEVSRDALKADLMKDAAEGRLDIVKQAVLMSGPGHAVKLGSMDDQSGSGGASKVSRAALTSLLLTGDDSYTE